MKKILSFGVLPLAAALLVSSQAHAVDPIKLKLGGFSTWMVGTAQNKGSFLRATGQQNPAMDVQGDNEIHFLGSTTLDNGITVGVAIEMEADQGVGNRANTQSDQRGSIEKNSLYAQGKFGKVILGSEDQGIYLTAVTSTAPGIGANDSYFTEGRWVVAPAGFTGQTSVAIDTGNGPEVNKITYVTPTFSGLTLGATFAPGANSSYGRDNYTHANAGTLGEAWGAAAQYKNKFGGFDVAASAGYMVTDVQNQLRDPLKEWNAGLNLGFAGFTVGGSYRDLSAKDSATGRKAFMDGYAWEAGVAYQTGPFGVGLNYFRSTAEASIANRNKDKQTVWSLNGNYEMGPGVNLIAGIANVKYDGEGTAAADDNRGWAGVTGFKLTF